MMPGEKMRKKTAGFGRPDDPEEVLRITYEPRGLGETGWGWRMPENPDRVLGGFTEDERVVMRTLKEGRQQEREASIVKTYTYRAPFNYPNVVVELGREGTGCEYNTDGVELDIPPYGAITISEDEPIVAVSVIGSGCSYHGYVMIEAEPLVWEYPRTAVRMKALDLYGMHVRGDVWGSVSERWNDAGLSCARFEIPESRKVIVMGGALGADPGYCFRIIRVDVKQA
ncbi:MAG: hypothetical protein HXS50_05910 [Theionarchaea archaeon]|nr:hypothetical protein [Theionarchaea archaeon]